MSGLVWLLRFLLQPIMSLSNALPPAYFPDACVSPETEDTGNTPPTYSYVHKSFPLAAMELVDYSSVSKGTTGTPIELILEAERTSASSMPTYTEGEPVRGRVALHLSKPQTIREVTVTVRGSITSMDGSLDHTPFLNIPVTLWRPSSSESQRSPSPNSASSSDTIQAHSKRLYGNFQWAFSIDLPKTVVASCGSRKAAELFKLPQTFTERHARVSIAYEACLRVRRGRLASDYRTSLGFVYIPLTRPGPPSLLRQIAYQEERPIPSPDFDPDGWYTAESTQFRGTIFGRKASVTCTLSLPKPLTYARGTPIPISLLLESDDPQPLDVLSSPLAITSRLRRVTKYCAKQDKKFDSLGWKDAVEDSQLASWWPCSDHGTSTSHRRRMDGELHIHKDAKPTTAISDFRIEYSLVLLAFDSIAFRGASNSSEPLLSVPVEVATMPGRGPQPRMYAPPSYEATDTRHVGPLFF
ncbi:hypothetical protein BKA70DRAFT_1262167 [Coprinopsis sp. MPI-PUGE-AT-0042]|nr:hypothetical protein BKA70DRAFT_1262167 [Coprinopsis sp. MPI-PUGE-AT-0042]